MQSNQVLDLVSLVLSSQSNPIKSAFLTWSFRLPSSHRISTFINESAHPSRQHARLFLVRVFEVTKWTSRGRDAAAASVRNNMVETCVDPTRKRARLSKFKYAGGRME